METNLAMNAQLAAILADLNGPQRLAVQHRDGPLLVLAGPGSGKTRVITRRAAYLVHTGVPASQILAITFTNKAADEMRRRITELGVGRGMWVHTFHALAARLLRELGPLVGVQPGFSIYDEADSLRLIKQAIESAGAGLLLRPQSVQAAISRAKNRLLTPQAFADQADRFEDQVLARVYAAYQQALIQQNAVDFDDLLMRVVLVLRDRPDLVERLNWRFRYLLIDEYQDTNHAQYVLAHLLARHHRNICATGDPDQSIYGWRGADISNILEFERDYPEALVVRLEQNYRSTGYILQAASALIAFNRRRKHKELWTQNGSGTQVRLWRFSEGRDEAEHIAETIQRLRAEGWRYGDFAIFYRINALSRGLEEALRARGIPYQIARGVEFYNRKEIKDTLAYLRLLVNPADDTALRRAINTPPRGIGKTTLDRVSALAAQRGCPLLLLLRQVQELPFPAAARRKLAAFVTLVDRIAQEGGSSVSATVSAALSLSGLEAMYAEEPDAEGEDRLANVQELVTAARRYEQEAEEPTLADFLHRVALVSDQDAIDESAGVVMLMTLHAAKGLEFPAVFIVGLEQGLLPHENALRESLDVEEERRLCFVGLTRAQRQLFLSCARERMIRGVPVPRPASQFLREIDPATIVCEDFTAVSYAQAQEPASPVDAGRFEPDPCADFDETDDWAQEDSQEGEKRRLRRKRAAPRRRLDVPRQTMSGGRADSRYADWKPGTLVEHARYGVGQVIWIRPGPGQTRAAIHFAGRGEKTFILELAPVRKVDPR